MTDIQRIQVKGPKNSWIEDACLRVAADSMVNGHFDSCTIQVSLLKTDV